MNVDEEEAVPTGYDPELPFFIKHRELVRRQAERSYRRQTRSDRRRQLLTRLTIVRPARRVISLAAVLTLIGATAYALTNRSIGTTPSTSPTQFASGGGAADTWTLSVWTRAGELCRDIDVNDIVQSSCALPPTGDHVQTLAVRSPNRSYVFGLTSAARVMVQVGSHRWAVSTQAPSTVASGAGLPPNTRWFIKSFAREAGAGASTAHVSADDR